MFDDVRVGCLATVNDNGSPRATPVHFVLTDSKLAWLSSEATHHSANIERDGKIDFVAWSSPTSVIHIETTARKATQDEQNELIRAYRDKLGDSPKLDGATMYVAEY